MMMRNIRLVLACCLLLGTGACSMHVVDIQQGTIITPEMVEQLKPGMTRSQVRFVMGTPTISDPFNQDRWDYVYTYATRNGMEERRHVAVHFDGERAVNISDSADEGRVW